MGLGTWRLFGAGNMDRAVDAAVANGYLLFDSAAEYGNEVQLGSAFQRHIKAGNITRKDIYIISKIMPTSGSWVPSILNRTLQRLGMDYVDMLLVHWPPTSAWGRKDMWQAFEKVQAEGKTRSIGVSNYNQNQLEEMRSYAKSWPPTLNQVEYHPRINKDALVEYHKKNGIFFQAYSSLNPLWVWHYYYLMWEPMVVKMAKKYGVDSAAVLLSYALTQGIGVVPKSVNAAHIRDNYQCVFKMSDEDIAQLDTLHGKKLGTGK